MLHFIYELIDPRTDTVFYIGITNDPNQRFQAHLHDAKTNDKKSERIEQLREESFEPRMRILEIVETREEAIERETYWIHEYLQQGIVLTNKLQLPYGTPRKRHKLIDSNMGRKYLATPEAAEQSGLTRTYLALLLRRGVLEGFQHGRDWFVYIDSLEQFLSAPRKSGPKGPWKNVSRSSASDVEPD